MITMSNNKLEIIKRFVNGAKFESRNGYDEEIDSSKVILVEFVSREYLGMIYIGGRDSNGQAIQAVSIGFENDEIYVSKESLGTIDLKIRSGKVQDKGYNFIYKYNKSVSAQFEKIKTLYFNDGKTVDINVDGTITMDELEQMCEEKEKQ